ncbi:probable ribose-5-phosphate isomerase 4, chloroplastic isoform X2 [Quercus lobata]|uniref:probable ribose-5-phosphate isomerase 4, chloroplastic isoform X2 n=1 Tax=Quercus lobata TaxID=97700 RepID=UPI001247AFF8|nr:probable ribose-5-phosphate isomerase 4, chloroplastic isoform X2 [Quercus lobata]
MASLLSSSASSSSSSTSLKLLHFPSAFEFDGIGRRRRRRRDKNNSLLKVTRSSLADASTLLLAAHHTVDRYIRSGMVIGLGSGCASGMAIQYMGRQLRAGALKDIVGVPTSVGSASEAAKAGIPLNQYQDCSQKKEHLLLSLGAGDYKSVLNAANKLTFMITESQYKGGLDGAVPVLVQSLNWMEIAEKIDDLFLGDAEVWRRPSIGQADPLGGINPLVTKEGHNVLDLIFTSPILSLAEVAESLDKVDGVVDHGVINKFPCTAVIASEDGLQIVDSLPRNAMEAL